jgi:hypothetical protein
MGQIFDKKNRAVRPCKRCGGRGIIAGAPMQANAPAKPME